MRWSLTETARSERRYPHGDLRRALLDAALAVLAEGGSAALSLREVARRAGVSHAAPYRHFSSREALLAAVAEEGFRALRSAMLEVMDGRGGGPLDQLLASGVGYVRFAVGHPTHFRVMFGAELVGQTDYPSLREAGHAAYALLVSAIEAGQVAGLIREAPAQHLALTCWSATHGLAMLFVDRQLEFQGVGVDQAELLAQLVVGGLYQGLRVSPVTKGAEPNLPPV